MREKISFWRKILKPLIKDKTDKIELTEKDKLDIGDLNPGRISYSDVSWYKLWSRDPVTPWNQANSVRFVTHRLCKIHAL